MDSFLGFFELGFVILMWMVIWNFVVKGFCARYPENSAVQGLAALLHA